MSRVLNAQSPSGTISPGGTFSSGFVPSNPEMPLPGSVLLKLTLQASDSNEVQVHIALKQGARVLSSALVTPTTSAQEFSLSVPVDSLYSAGSCTISDFSVEVTAAELIPTDCCPDPLPSVLPARISSSCGSVDGQTVSLVYDPEFNWWIGYGFCDDHDTDPPTPREYSIIMRCTGPGGFFNLSWQKWCISPDQPMSSLDCSKPKMTFSTFFETDCGCCTEFASLSVEVGNP